MPATPSGVLSTRIDTLREALAASSALQTLLGVADAAGARAKLIIAERTSDDLVAPPVIYLGQVLSMQTNRVAIATRTTDTVHRVTYFGAVDADYAADADDAQIDARNQVGALLGILQDVGSGATVGTAYVTFDVDEPETITADGGKLGFVDPRETTNAAAPFGTFVAVFAVRMGPRQG